MQPDVHDGLAVGPHAVFGLDATGRCTHSTGPALAHIGLRPGELVGANLFELYRDDPLNVDALRRVLAGETFSLEREFQGRLLSTYFEPVRDADGTVTGGLGVTTDITEQRRIERQLHAARERAALLADVSAALSRDLLDPEALIRTTVRSLTNAVADVGLAWVRTSDEQSLFPAAVWTCGAERDSSSEPPWTADDPRSRLDVSALADVVRPQPLAVDGIAATTFSSPARRWDACIALRVPLRSRNRLLGVVDVARAAERGTFSEEETGLVAEVAERCALALDHSLLLQAHREAREELVKFQALADASDDLIAITDNEDRTVYLNPRVRTSGVPLTGRVWETAAEVRLDEGLQGDLRRSLQTEGRWSGDVTVAAGGTPLMASVSVFRLFHPESGAPLGTAWIGQDVTELRATEAALREANSDLLRFKALVDASPDFIAIADMHGRVEYVNPAGRTLVGLAAGADVSTTTIADFTTPEGLVGFDQRVMPTVLARGHWEGESRLRSRRNGSHIPVATSTFVVRDVTTHEPFALATVQRDITERRAAETAVRELAEQRQALLTRLVDAQDAERSRIAADVHDDPVQACAAAELRAGLLRRKVAARAPDLVSDVDAVETSVAGATDRLRSLLFDLEPPDLERGLGGALTRAAREILEDGRIGWTVDAHQEPDASDTARTIAYRIVKEALINVRKHAQARNVSVSVAGRDGGLEVSVVDDGVGIGPDPVEPSPGHRGLVSMQDRATVAGGRCTIRNHDGGGTVVTVWLPGPPLPHGSGEHVTAPGLA
jgi:PAS domain S-box-containing protein